MANLRHVKLVKEGRDALALWRANHLEDCLDLSGATLYKADLSGFVFGYVKLTNADLRGANLIYGLGFLDSCGHDNFDGGDELLGIRAGGVAA